MVNDGLAIAPPKISSRQIGDSDVEEVVNLLSRGFSAQRSRKFWQHVLEGLASRPVPAGYPRYGYVLESDGNCVGVFLEIFSTVWVDGKPQTRCNVSSLYVDPRFRLYASLLESQMFKHKGVTLSDITPTSHRYPVLDARGFTQYSNGSFIAVPALSWSPGATSVRILEARTQPDARFDVHEREMLLEHADFGCVCLWCVTPERAYPFMFRPRPLKGFLRCARLVYCRDIEDFVRFSRPIGLYLARRLEFLVMIDANGPIRGLVGKYFADKERRYFRGPDQPRLGDLAYTEISLFGM
jgi:hypothetical protein